MAEELKFVDLDPKDFKLNDYDNVRIEMPVKPAMTEEDIEAQLFEYVLSSGKHIVSVADLDDEWVKANFEGLETIDDVKEAIKADFDHSMLFELSDIKYQACCRALLARLEGEIPADVLANNVEATRAGNLERLAEMHISLEQYLREESMTLEDYEEKLVAEVEYQMRMNVALDIMADVLCMQVGNHEITEYLSAPNPQAFLDEIREKGLVEQARKAAVRVKVMRRVVDTAIVTEVDEDGNPIPEAAPQVEEEPLTEEEMQAVMNLDKMPIPHIKDETTTSYSWERLD